MSAKEFLEQLEKGLEGMQPDERENAMGYYREYFMDADDEDAAAARLGSPQSVAERIIAEADGPVEINLEKGSAQVPADAQPTASSSEKKPDAGRTIIATIAVILSFPFWIGPIIVWLVLILLAFVIPFSFAVSGVFSPIQGIIDIFGGYLGYGIYEISSGMLLIGLAMLLWYPGFLFAKHSFKLMKKIICMIYGKEK